MYTAVVELDTLTDTDGAGAEYDNFFLVGVQVFNKLCSLVVVVVKGARLGGRERLAKVKRKRRV